MKHPSNAAHPPVSVRIWLPSLSLALLLRLLQPQKAFAEDRVEYRFEDYNEDGTRMRIQTHSAYAEKELTSKVTARGTFVYDSISGASPTGGYPSLGSQKVPINSFPIHDIRRAEAVELGIRYGGNHTTTPQLAFSKEFDYESIGLAMNHAIDFNQRNTTLLFGVSKNFDRVKGLYQSTFRNKETLDGLIGINQILGPNTHMTANLTLGHASGYLTDPYKGVNFYFPYPGASPEDYPVEANVGEIRPDEKFRQVVFLGLTHYLPKLKGSGETSYRFHHDDFGILSHTLAFQWNQKIGSRVTLSPSFRYYRQTDADFYIPRVVGDSEFPDGTRVAYQDGEFVDFEGGPAFPEDLTGFDIINIPAHPTHFSADYRLSAFQSLAYGVSLQWKVHDHFTFTAGYRRYEMSGLNPATPKDAFPSAHVLTIGFGIFF